MTTAIRIGTCGGLQTDIAIRGLFLADDAIMEQDFSAGGVPERPDPPCFRLPRQGLRRLASRSAAGPCCAATSSITRNRRGQFDQARAAGKLAVDMETSAVLGDARWLGVRALSMCTVVDNPVTGHEMAP